MPYTDNDRTRDAETRTLVGILVKNDADKEGRIRILEKNQIKAFFGQGIVGGVVAFCTAWVTK